jgi:hypothetical protein
MSIFSICRFIIRVASAVIGRCVPSITTSCRSVPGIERAVSSTDDEQRA